MKYIFFKKDHRCIESLSMVNKLLSNYTVSWWFNRGRYRGRSIIMVTRELIAGEDQFVRIRGQYHQ